MREPELFVERSGAGGPTVVLGHGFGGSARNFRAQTRALADAAQFVLHDARGHARSEAPEGAQAYRPAAFVGDLERIVAESGPEPVVVGGLSMGAGIALRFALAHPERVRALVLASFPRAGDDPEQREWALGFADAIDREGLESAGARYAWGQASRFDPKGAALVRQGFLEHPAHALAHTLRELIAIQPSVASLASELAELRVPALVIAGSEDRRSLEPCRALAGAIPGARLIVIPGGGHVVNLTSPGPFNDALAALLHTLSSAIDSK
jgi:pimeloyl-ACP methyl ester carboxylesterase